MRRLIIILLCLGGLGLLALLLLPPRRRRASVAPAWQSPAAAATPPAAEPVAPAATEPEPAPALVPVEPAGDAEPDAPDPPEPQPVPDRAAERARTLQVMAELRASIIDGVSRRPLYLMAVERGVHRDMFVASSWDLLDAILRAEGLSPELRDASPDAVRRLRALADEASAREQQERRQSLEHYEVYRRFWDSSSA